MTEVPLSLSAIPPMDGGPPGRYHSDHRNSGEVDNEAWLGLRLGRRLLGWCGARLRLHGQGRLQVDREPARDLAVDYMNDDDPGKDRNLERIVDFALIDYCR